MKRFCALAVLMLSGSPAGAGESFSFVIGGHHIHVEAPRHCRSASCVSVSIPGVYEKRARGDRYDDDAPSAPPVAEPAAPAPSPSPAAQPATCTPAVAPVVAPQVVVTTQQPASPVQTAAIVSALLPPRPAPVAAPAPQPPPVAASLPPPPPSAAIAQPAEAALPPASAARPPRISKVVHRREPEPDSPLGDWQTEGHKGMVRIEPCGQVLCGYVLDPGTNSKGETVLIDMKSKASTEWSGNIYSRDSGNTYYATMTLKGPDLLQVEACALGQFFCTGNAWSRIATSDRIVTYREASTSPRS